MERTDDYYMFKASLIDKMKNLLNKKQLKVLSETLDNTFADKEIHKISQ